MISKNKVIYTIVFFILLWLAILLNLKADLELSDIENAEILSKNNIINSQKDPKNYNLLSNISRREMLKIMLNLAWEKPNDDCINNTFKDILSSDWACKYTQKALSLWYISNNSYFRPNDLVTQTEALKMIFEAKNIEVIKTTPWEDWYINKALELWYLDKKIEKNIIAKRNFVFNIWSKTLKNTDLKISKIEQKIEEYKKPVLKINFANSMDSVSVEKNIKTYPEVKYTSSWDDPKTLSLVVDDLITKETDLLVNVLDKALTSSWENLKTPIFKTFKINWEAVVEFVSPNGNINDLNQNITISFSKPITSLTNLDNQEKCFISISPNIPGKCVWITTSTMQFRPTNWFPTWWKYLVTIPSWIKTISWDTTINSKTFEIITPDFVLNSNITSLNLDESLKFAFNDEVSLSDFEKNFALKEYKNDLLKFSYFKGVNDLEENKTIIEVFPKTWDFWYEKTLNYTINKSLTSKRWNIWLKNDIIWSIKTNSFLLNYNPVVLLDEKKLEKYDISNFKNSLNNSIITTNNPSILLTFDKEVELLKKLFDSKLPFELNYAKVPNYEDKTKKLIENKKQILITFSWSITNDFSLKLKLSSISSSDDKILNFKTKQKNTIVSYTQIDYKSACLESKNPLSLSDFWDFEFDKYAKIDYLNEVNEWTKNKDCSFENQKNKYILNMRLNPNSKYNLTIKKTLLDSDNYALDKDYQYSFITPKAKNEDKNISFIDGRWVILVPNSIKPLSVALNSINLDSALLKICYWDFKIDNKNYLQNEICKTQNISLNNMWFKPNISVIDLEKILWVNLEDKVVLVELSKNLTDKSTYEITWWHESQKINFILSDIWVTLKSGKNNILWLHNYLSQEELTDEVLNIKSYTTKAKYNKFWWYDWQQISFVKDVWFTPKNNWLYEIESWDFNILLITLKSNKQVLLDNMYNYTNQNDEVYNFIQTDKPIYKAWEEVNIFWISKILTPTSFEINNKNINISITDSKYKEILNKNISLNKLWAFETSFKLAKDAPLWNYNILIWSNNMQFLVEEYQKPDFEIKLNSQKENYLFWEDALIDVKWDYYAQMPLSFWEWTYKLNSSKYIFDWQKTPWYHFWEEENYLFDYVKEKSIWNFETNTQEETWNFVLDNLWENKLKIKLKNSNIDKIYTLQTTITDPNTKKSISKNTTFKALRWDEFLGIKFDKYYYSLLDEANISFVVTNLNWEKLKNIPFDLNIYKIDYNYNKNTYDYETKENLIKNTKLNSSNSWETISKFIFSNPWEYRFELTNQTYKTTKTIYISSWDILNQADQDHSLNLLSNKDIYNIWEKAKIMISSPVIWVKALLTIEKLNKILDYKIIDINNYSQEVEVPVLKDYLPNFNVWVYLIKDIKSSWDSLDKLKTLREEMQILEAKLIKEKNNIFVPYRIYDLSIIPNDDLDYNLDDLTKLANLRQKEIELLNKILPNYYSWNIWLNVEITSINLESSIKLDKTTYLPWDKVKLDFEVLDSLKNKVSWELSFSVIDKSLLALKNNKIDIKNYFYSNKENYISTFWNLDNLIKRIDFNIVKDEALDNSIEKQSFWWWISSMGQEKNMVSDSMEWALMLDMAIPESKRELWETNTNESKIRTEFKDLAFYKSKVEVVDWKASIIIPKLPDNLTSWVISWFVYDGNQKVWDFEKDFVVEKKLSLIPQMPNFFLSWDETEVWALILNNLDQKQVVDISLDMTNLTQSWVVKKTLTLNPKSQIYVWFKVNINPNILNNLSNTTIKLNLSSANYQDNIVLNKIIYPSKTSEYVFTNWMTDDASYEEKLDFLSVLKNWWELEISMWASILTNLTKNLDKVLVFPYDDLNSKITFLKNSASLKNLYIKLWKLNDFENIILTNSSLETFKIEDVIDLTKNDIQNYLQNDFGLSYFKNCSSWFRTDSCSSLEVTRDFLLLNIEVNWISNQKVLNYYKNALIQKINDAKRYNYNVDLSYFTPLAIYKDSEFIKNNLVLNQDLSNLEKLEYLDIYHKLWIAWEKELDFLNELKNSVLIEARASILPANKSFVPGDDSLSTAKMIEVLINKKQWDKLLLQNLTRFLIWNRDENWNYYSYSFSEIIDALTNYIDYTKELEWVSFDASATLDWKDILNTSFNDKNKLQNETKSFDLSILNKNNSLFFSKTWTWKLYYDVWVRYYLPVSDLKSRDEGIIVERNFYDYNDYNLSYKKECFTPWWWYYIFPNCHTIKTKNIDNISFAKKWDLVVWEIKITLPVERNDVIINSFIPSWFEILNTNFDTTSNEVKDISWEQNKWYFNNWFDFVEQKEDWLYLYAKHLNAWTYTYTFVSKANNIWNYNLKPTIAETINSKEIWGRSSWWKFEIK